ncbi:hypothetical protein QAD02_016369 [Eretmocerus hayati]|uniref:Uncharacterized protein n=1 Tax=Eretmocerus hayati TaxID=131215 RepID=A0ACC2PAV9_9HYME|nr:hypothetical protein QAD02_016369 [Eretmocerus hayati]
MAWKREHSLIIILMIFRLDQSTVSSKRLTKKPHIILIVADDLGWNDVSFHGADQIPTPNIDALAYNGVILNRHYTLPICTPSRTTLMTGRNAIRDGMQGSPLRPGEPRGVPLNSTILPELLRNRGYATHLVGKWHLGYSSLKNTPVYRGFDTFYGYYNGFITYFNHTITEKGMVGKDLHRDEFGKLGIDSNYSYFTDLITDEAVNIIHKNGNRKPLFLEIAHLAVHASDGEETLEVRNLDEVRSSFPHIKNPGRQKYAGMIKAMDESVGRVVQSLQQNNMLENSIVIFMSDNGAPTYGVYENFGSNYPLRGIKDTMFEGGVRGAACVFSPLIERPARISNGLMHISDWYPTLYSIAGGDLRHIHNIDGLDQWSMITSGSESKRRDLLLNIDEARGMEGAISGNYKLIRGAKTNGGHYGDSGNDPTYPVYHANDALTSSAGLAIKKLSRFPYVSPSKAEELRKAATIKCNRSNSSIIDCSGSCLFDIINDPCEYKNLIREKSQVVELLSNKMRYYKSTMVKQTNAQFDPCSEPKNFEDVWMPWRKRNDQDPSKCDRPDYNFPNKIQIQPCTPNSASSTVKIVLI